MPQFIVTVKTAPPDCYEFEDKANREEAEEDARQCLRDWADGAELDIEEVPD